MKTPKTPIEFDYDLWTTEDGKCIKRFAAYRSNQKTSKKIFQNF